MSVPSAPRIHILDDHLISQIAAGEVVERPASVVKELVENSLDAGATAVEVALESGGKRRIKVTDDGIGLGKDDALLAFDRHATSKISSFEELERVGTLGFRGEALASIAAVARVELTTSTGDGEGQRVRIEGGRVKVAEPAARARGTTIEVASLFFNVPARRKFLKKPATELRRCIEVVQGYALARPDVRFTLSHGGRTLLDALPVPSDASGLTERVASIFGRELADELAEIPRREHGKHEALWGLVGSPATSKGRRLFVFVNRRLLRDRAILAVFYRTVREEWKGENFPALFLFLDVAPEDVDVNVHPQKAEVRFRDLSLLDRVGQALRAGLDRARGEEAAPLRTPAGPPTMPFAGREGGGGVAEPRSPYGGYSGKYSGGAWWKKSRPTADEADSWTVSEVSGTSSERDPEVPGTPFATPFDSPAPEVPGTSREDVPEVSDTSGSRLSTVAYAPMPERSAVPLSGRSGEKRPFRLLGQYKGTLILLEGPDGLYLIDQHVAHERLLYERLRRSFHAEETPSQRLLTPPLLELSTPEKMRLAELAPALEPYGFSVVELSGDDLALTAVPAVLDVDEAERLLVELATGQDSGGDGGDGDGEGAAHEMGRRILDSLAASLSCKGAVKMHHPLTPEEMETLVVELFEAENPYACPHGRPIVLEMTDADLERRFGRR